MNKINRHSRKKQEKLEIIRIRYQNNVKNLLNINDKNIEVKVEDNGILIHNKKTNISVKREWDNG